MKLYYDDPLQAAYMAREFGVKYTYTELKGKDKYSYNYWPFFDYDYDGQPECATQETLTDPCINWDIHPDSHGVFDPEPGDIFNDNFVICMVKCEYPQYSGLPEFPEDEALELIRKRAPGVNAIIQRNGKPFFMPKVKEPTNK